jgi:hypothetical protein
MDSSFTPPISNVIEAGMWRRLPLWLEQQAASRGEDDDKARQGLFFVNLQ